jgi:hypothetical protein
MNRFWTLYGSVNHSGGKHQTSLIASDTKHTKQKARPHERGRAFRHFKTSVTGIKLGKTDNYTRLKGISNSAQMLRNQSITSG